MTKHIYNNLKNPNLFLFFAFVSSAVVLILVGTHTYNVMEDVLENSAHSQIIRDRVENIRFFDEVLTSSALLAASSGNVQWEKRYRLFEPKLDSAINELLRMDPLHTPPQTLKMTDSANVHLMAMEHQVFELVHLERRSEAYEIITGSDYARQKAIHSEGLSTFIKLHELETAQQQTRLHEVAKRSRWSFGLVILLLSIVWLPIVRLLHKSRVQMYNQNQELELQITERKNNELKIDELKTNLELILNAVGEGIYGLDNNGNTTYINKVFETITGWKSEEIIGKPMHPLIHHTKPDGAPYPQEHCPTCMSIKEGGIFEDENEYFFRKDGSGFFVEYVSTPILKDDKIVGAVVIFKDITHRLKAEEKIKMLAHAVRNSDDCIAITDKDYKIIFVNDSFCKVYGFEEEEIIGQTIAVIISMNNLPEVGNGLYSSMEKKETWTGEVISKRKDGNDFPVQLSLAPLLDDKGELIAIVGVLRDITERKYTEEALRASQQLIEGIINAISVRVFWKDKDLVYLGCNTIFARDAGFSDPKDIIGKDDFQMGWRDQAELYRSGDRQVIESGDRILLNEEPQTTPDGDTIILLTNKIPLQNSMGEICGILGTSMDITDRIATVQEIKLKNEELQKLNAEKDKFFSIIAHDLRSPFNGFLGLTQIMVEELSSLSREELQDIAVSLQNSATNLFRLLENLLEWARIKQGLIPFNPEIVQLFIVVDKSTAIMVEPAKNKGIEIANDIPKGLEVFADSNILQTIIRNLISNAVKFTHKGGKISISAKFTVDKSIEISVKDNGIGMSPKMIDHLFRLDIQTGRKGTEGESSSGLGLLLCKEFIEKHGGKLWIESEEGKGSVFYFTIPYNEEQEEKEVFNNVFSTEGVENKINPEVSGLKILISDLTGFKNLSGL